MDDTDYDRATPGARLFKVACDRPGDLDPLRVWVVVPMAKPDPRFPGMTHNARWYATRAADTAWRFSRRRPGEMLSGHPGPEEAAELEALPLTTEAELDVVTGVAAFNEQLYAECAGTAP